MTDAKVDLMLNRYAIGTQEMETRLTRKNGWNEIIDAYMGKLPTNWPYNSVVTDPRIRTTILEKTGRLLNGKLQGRLVPREGGDIVKARVQNAILDYQWDNATTGGSMIEKIALADQYCRIFGASFVYTYWDNEKNSNEMKLIDPRDIWFDGAATTPKNAQWCQIREFTTISNLEKRGYNVKNLKRMAKKGELSSNRQDTAYSSQVKANRSLENRVGENDGNTTNPILEVVTDWDRNTKKCTVFLPKYGEVVYEAPFPYAHKCIPIAMLRYYPLLDDIYGESEVESVLPLQRAIWAMWCGFLDEMNISMRPPLKIVPTGTRLETIVYGPGAKWITNNPSNIQEMEFSGKVIANFNATFPALVAAFNTAMGDSSLGIQTTKGTFDTKTATEVKAVAQQQNNRDQYNQLYLSEFLKDIMMMWVSNNKQYLLDDPRKHYVVMRIVGKDAIKLLQNTGLADRDIPEEAINGLSEIDPTSIGDRELKRIGEEMSVPRHGVLMNPDETNPENYEIKPKLDVMANGEEADLYIEKSDFDGSYDYIPDIKSMAAGAGQQMKEGRIKTFELILNPQVQQMLQADGQKVKIKELLTTLIEDSGNRDAEALFEPLPVNPMQNGQPTIPPGAGNNAPGAGPMQPQGNGGLPIPPAENGGAIV